MSHAADGLLRLAGRTVDDAVGDAELVRRLGTDRRDAAFAALVHRHGPLVLGVCRRVLGDHHAAEDAFQATFLVLLRRGGALGAVSSLAGWLHGVATRVSRKALVRLAVSRVREREARAVSTPEPDPDDLGDVRPILDEEIARLDRDSRSAVVLCYFEGKTYQEAAAILGWPPGTVSGRLARARDLLRTRLTRRGVVCPAAGLAALLASQTAGAVPPALAVATLRLLAEQAAASAVAGLAATEGTRRGLAFVIVSSVAVVGIGAAAAALTLAAPTGAPIQPGEATRTSTVEESRFSHPTAVAAVAVSPRGDLVATAGADPGVNLWRLDGTPARRIPAHADGTVAAAFSPDGRTLATAGHDGVVRVWTVAGEMVHALPGHGEAASAVTFSPDGRTLVSAGWDGAVRMWDAQTGKAGRVIEAHRGKAWGVAFSHDGRALVSVGEKELCMWNTEDGRLVRRVGGLKGGAYAVAFVDPRTVAVSADNTVSLISVDTGRETARVGGPRKAVAWFAVSPDGRTLAWGGGRAVRLWEVATQQERAAFTTSQDVTCLAFAADGDRLLAGGSGGRVVVWRLSRVGAVLEDRHLEAAWSDLTGTDAPRAYRAARSLAATPDLAVPFLARKLPTGPDLDARLGRLVADLDAPGFHDREEATRELRTLGHVAAPALHTAERETSSPEVRQRAEALLKQLPPEHVVSVPLTRTLEVLETCGTADARGLLERIAGQKPENELVRQASLSVDRLRQRPPH